MISVISPITYGDNERSRLSGLVPSGEFVFKDVIRESTKSCVYLYLYIYIYIYIYIYYSIEHLM